MKRALVAIYNHPEYYPPTLNAIDQLALAYDSVHILGIPNMTTTWSYPANAQFTKWNTKIPSDRLNKFQKIYQFLLFMVKMRSLINKHRPDTILLYDHIALYAYSLIKNISRRPKTLWYHSHDVLGDESFPKFSVNGLAKDVHSTMLSHIDLFSLPSEERCAFFPMNVLKGQTVILPNYPSKHRYNTSTKRHLNGEQVRIIYQGTISEGRGIEETLDIIKKQVSGKSIRLTLVGKPASQTYLNQLLQTVKDRKLEPYFEYIGLVKYEELIKHTMSAHIGLALMPANINYNTAGTASNKIYEYAACGLPVLYPDNDHYNKYLSHYEWAVSTKPDEVGIISAIKHIVANYESLSERALTDFQDHLNYEHVFRKINDQLN